MTVPPEKCNKLLYHWYKKTAGNDNGAKKKEKAKTWVNRLCPSEI